MLRSTLVVTGFTVLSQMVSFLVWAVSAALFGTNVQMDAFLAAVTLPQYVTAVLLNALAFVLVPVFVQYRSDGREAEAWRVVSAVITLCVITLGGLALVGVVFAEELLHLTIPGLGPDALQLAARMAVITWPIIVPAGVFSLLAGIYNAHGRFGWPAAAPVLGGVANLVLLWLLVPSQGVVGLAIATTGGTLLQAGLLAPIVLGAGRFRPALDWSHPGVREVLRLLAPLIISGVAVRWTPVVDRFLASRLPEGAIARLGYAFILVTVLARALSTGLATVIFPQMAVDAGSADREALRRRISIGLRGMWLTVAPFAAIGVVLALPATAVIFERGRFGVTDTTAVSGLLRIYLVALLGMCLGNITARGFYVLRETRTLAILGIAEAIAYVGYTSLLAWRFGAAGIAVGYVLYFNLSIVWQALLLRRRTGPILDRQLVDSFARTTGATLVAAAVAYLVSVPISSAFLRLTVAGTAGLLAYGVALWLVGSREAELIRTRLVVGHERI